MKSKIHNIIVEATCDICGEDCMKPLFEPMKSDGDRDEHDISKEFGGIKLKAIWCFASEKDTEVWDAVICETCVNNHLFKLVNFTKKH